MTQVLDGNNYPERGRSFQPLLPHSGSAWEASRWLGPGAEPHRTSLCLSTGEEGCCGRSSNTHKMLKATAGIENYPIRQTMVLFSLPEIHSRWGVERPGGKTTTKYKVENCNFNERGKKKRYKMRGGEIFPIYSKTYHKATVFTPVCSREQRRSRIRPIRIHMRVHTHILL